MISGEESIESRDAQIAAGWVAVNRLNSGNFGATLSAVITQPKAFQGYNFANTYSDDILSIAQGILGGTIADNTNGALYFVNTKNYIDPILSNCGANYKKMGSTMYVYSKYCSTIPSAV